MTNPDSEFQQKIKEYSPYLEDLFKRIYFLTVSFVILFLVGFILSAPILRFLTHFFDFNNVVLTITSPFQFVDLAMTSGMFFAVIFLIPLFLWHFYSFIKTALQKKEKKILFLLLPTSIFLFLLGFAYSFSILYFTMQALANLNSSLGVENLWDISVFLSQIVATSALLGLFFEFPIIITFLIKFGLFDVNFLKSKRRHAVLGMFILTSLLPPTDGISLLVMVVPLIVMYEVTIMCNRITSRHVT
jgi:sec-independent protein translocase protein TatC